jgi:hypothetical protein
MIPHLRYDSDPLQVRVGEPIHDLRGTQRITAQIEERIRHSDRVEFEHVGPDLGDSSFERRRAVASRIWSRSWNRVAWASATTSIHQAAATIPPLTAACRDADRVSSEDLASGGHR